VWEQAQELPFPWVLPSWWDQQRDQREVRAEVVQLALRLEHLPPA
jgi:hypothetical protein